MPDSVCRLPGLHGTKLFRVRLPKRESNMSVYKIIRQYGKGPIPEEDMRKLIEIAGDYGKVKNYVYARFGGIASLSKLYPGYTVQNEMTASGLRDTLGIPSVYFYLAVFDALGEIKAQWTRTKTHVQKNIGRNEQFTEEEKHYLSFLLKINSAFEQVLNQKPVELPQELAEQYTLLSRQADTERLQKYLCRQVRKCHVKLHTENTFGFSLSERAYRYGDGGIYISTKEKRKRIFIPLTDHNQYKSQLYMKLNPKEGTIQLHVPVRTAVRRHPEYTGRIGIAFGMYTMLTTHEGRRYGEELGTYQTGYADWIRRQAGIYQRNKESNPGRKKYQAKKKRMEEQLHSYINQELNRFLQTEKPRTIYMAKLPGAQGKGKNKRINYSVSLWQRGYIRKRLAQKCEEQSVELVEVWGKDISRECSRCGCIVTGSPAKQSGSFHCPSCGFQEEEKTNTARNAKKRGQGEGELQRS